MIVPRKVAKRLLQEVLARSTSEGRLEADGEAAAYVAEAIHEALDESDLVLRGAENVEQKARRYLTEGRLVVTTVRPADGMVVAECRGGDGTLYHLGHDPAKKEWRCTCPAPKRCAHLIALRLVTTT